MSIAYRRLIAGLAFFQVVHALALLAMLGILLPGLDPAQPMAARSAYVHQHLWRWRIGWLPWQLCAVSDLWVTLALAAWVRSRWSLLACVALLLAIVPEQLAEAALLPGAPSPELLRSCMWWTGTWAATGYTAMTACWLRALPDPSPGFRRFASVVLVAFSASAVANHFAWHDGERLAAFQWASVLNGVGFGGLFAIGFRLAMLAGERRLGYPARPSASFSDELARSAGLRDVIRALQHVLPFPRLRSDMQDVLYVNWLVAADALQALVPGGLPIRRYGDKALLSVLVYRHGHFGPALLGPLRRCFPNPRQCNLRAYLETPSGHVAFVANSLDSSAYVLGSRLLSDGLPAQRAEPARHDATETRFQPAPGWDFGLSIQRQAQTERSLPAEFAAVFGDWTRAIEYIVPQNAAVRFLPTIERSCASDIVVDVPTHSAQPAAVLRCELTEPWAGLIARCEPFAFVLPAVRFTVVGERLSARLV